MGGKLSLAPSSAGLLFDPEDGGSMFLQNFWLPLNYSVTQQTVLFRVRESFREGSRMAVP
jgi:hypothetical protein